MIRAVTRWIIPKTMINEHKRSKLPKKSDKSEQVKAEKLNIMKYVILQLKLEICFYNILPIEKRQHC